MSDAAKRELNQSRAGRREHPRAASSARWRGVEGLKGFAGRTEETK